MRKHNRYTVTTALHASDSFVLEAARILYLRQTNDERHSGMSVHVNLLGYNRADSETMTGIVEAMDLMLVSAEGIVTARERCLKYARQLASHMNGQHIDLGLTGWEVLGR